MHGIFTLRRVMTATLIAMTLAGVALGGPLRDAEADYERGDYATALRLFRTLAAGGKANAQSNLAFMYHMGKGVPQDHAEAVRWYRRSAEQGDADAQYNLGVMYSDGVGAPPDYLEARKWYRKAADRGDPLAQYKLGVMTASGQGAPVNDVEAYLWFDLAASRGPASDAAARARALAGRDAVAGRMTPAQIAEAQKLAGDWKPAK